VQALQGVKLTAWKALYSATRGAARALHLEHEVGSLEAGTLADLAVWDWACGPVAAHRDGLARNKLYERVFAWMTLGDERNLCATYVAGTLRHRRADTAP
jgi:guanine deaminase